jgi:serine/threonine protein kinase
MDRLTGQVLNDRYRIQSLLAHQTGRRAFLAKDLQTGQSVVVKLVLFGCDLSWDDVKLFEREAEVLKSLDYPTIPKYIDYFDVELDRGKGFALVQTYIEARSLQDWIESGRTFSEEDIKEIAKELLKILDYLHNRQPPVVHRDIKPSNILLGDRSGNSLAKVYLVDFGSVQTAINSGTRTIVGTYGYMPPEQFGGQSAPTSDLYSLGATLIYLATGQHPDRLPQQEMRILFEDRVNLRPDLINWLKWLTEPSIDLRLKSAQQALEALEKPNLRERGFVKIPKPFGSKVRISNTPEMFEILIPPRGFYSGLIPLIGFAIVWNSFLVMWYGIALTSWNSGGWLSALFAIFHLGIGLGMIWNILFTLLGKMRLRITRSEIVFASEILGLRFSSLAAARHNITKIELIRLSYRKDPQQEKVEVSSQINIWVGIKKISLGTKNSLTALELDWLAHDLSNWLNLPIVKT